MRPATAASLAADTIERLENEVIAASLRIENDALEIFNLEAAMISRYDEICNLIRERDSLTASNESYITLANTAYEILETRTAKEIDDLAREHVGLSLDATMLDEIDELCEVLTNICVTLERVQKERDLLKTNL